MANRFFGRFKEQMKDEDCLPELVSLEIEESDDDVEAEGMQKDQSINELKSSSRFILKNLICSLDSKTN